MDIGRDVENKVFHKVWGDVLSEVSHEIFLKVTLEIIMAVEEHDADEIFNSVARYEKDKH